MSESSDKPADDELLSDLLDSALGDFKTAEVTKPVNASTSSANDKEKLKKAGLQDSGHSAHTTKPKKQASASSRAATSQPVDDDLASMNSMLGDLASALGGDPNSQNMEAQLGALMQLLKQEDPTLFNKFQTLNERATQLDDESSEVDFANILQDTLSYLNDGLKEDNEGGEGNSERTANAAGAADSANDGDGDGDDGVPLANLEQFVDSASEMMRSLLARSVFYPLVKSLTSKYPEWIATHRAQLDTKTVQNHERQCAALRRIRGVYEQSEDQSDVLSAAEFDSVIALLREAQSFGDPPRELLDETGSSAFTALGRNACVLM